MTEIKTIAGLCLAASEKYRSRPALAMLKDGKICRQLTYTDLGIKSRQIGQFLRDLGILRGSRVLLISENCPEWSLFYFGIALAGAVSVPLLSGFSPSQIKSIVSHAGVSAIVLSRSMAQKFCLKENSEYQEIPFIYIDGLIESLKNITVSINGMERELPLKPINDCGPFYESKPGELASIIYTSGTQGNSKGVMLSAENIISCVLSSVFYTKLYPKDRVLSVLPLAHAYECSIGFLYPIYSGASITYLDKAPSPSVLLPALKLLRPTAMITVPLLMEKIYHNSIAPKLKKSPLYKFKPGRFLAVHAAGRKLYSAMGGKLRFFGIGGAALSAEVEEFLCRIKFPYAIGYGLTEAAPLVAGTKPRRFAIHSVGIAAKGVNLRIQSMHKSSKEGEIQIKGPNVMMGYYKDPEKTREAFTQDGWLRTGDLGQFDKKGRLHIKGRIKTLILGPSGENIYPEEIESLLGSSLLVEDVLVYSCEKGELVALVSLSEAAKAAAGAMENALEDLRAWANKKLSAFSRINRIEIRHEPFEKTPTMKIKRYLYS